jgi:hypothetical protein
MTLLLLLRVRGRGGEGGVSLLGLLRFISSLTVHVVPVVHNAPAMTAGGVRVYVRYDTSRIKIDLVSCLVL